DTCEYRKRPQPIERTTDKLPPHHLYSFEIRSQSHALKKGGHNRAPDECFIPKMFPPRSGLEAKLESNATENQAQQHENERQHKCTEYHRIRERKSRQQPCPTKHQPGFVTIPHGRNGVHHDVTVFVGRKEWIKNSDSKIE